MLDACLLISGFLFRGERRRIKALAPAIGSVTKRHALFFERFPSRQHRVRLAARAEVEIDAILKSEPDISTAPGGQWVTIVKQLAPGVRLRVVERSIGRDPADFDVNEDMARWDYDEMVVAGTYAHQIEARMRAALAGMVGVRP